MRRVGWILGVLAGIGVFGLARAQDKYAAEPLVVVRNDKVYRMNADGTGVVQTTIAGRIQSEAGLKQVGVLAVPFAAKSSHVEWVYARVEHADGSVAETPVANAMEVTEQVTREAPFYSDLKESQLPLKDLRVGDTLEWQCRVVLTTPEATGQFWGSEAFVKGTVSLEQSVELRAPKSVWVNAWGKSAKPVESFEGDMHVWRWTNAELKPTVGAEADAAKEAEKKRVRTADEELDAREGALPDAAWTTFRSWEEVGAWYRGLEGSRAEPDAAVKAQVARLTAGKTTEREKVEAVYEYVGLQIHYIGVSLGIGRYQPHEAQEVMDNQYGDCKDKHTLLAAMLKTLGLKPDAVLIGAGIRFNEAVPSPTSFNHLITRVEVEGRPLWLDATAEVAPPGLLMRIIRGHSALVVPDTGAAAIERTPAASPFPQTLQMEAKGTLDADGLSNSKITLTFHGDDEVVIRAVVRQISPAQYDQMAQGMCGGMGYGGTASHTEVGRADDLSTPMWVRFDYRREKAGDWDNLRTIPQLSPVQLPRPDAKEPPVEALELGTPQVQTSLSAMKLPEGWTVEFPEAVHVKSKWVTVDETYRFDKGTMYAERRVEVLAERVPQADWKEYSKFAEKANLGNDLYVQLVRGSAAGARAASAANPAGANQPAPNKTPGSITLKVQPPAKSGAVGETGAGGEDLGADGLMRKAATEAQHGETEAAQADADKAKALQPNAPGLWMIYGVIAMQKSDLPGALADYRKELAAHPQETRVYPAMVQVQLALKRRDEAKSSLRQWAEADLGSAEPALQLAQMELEDEQPEDAVQTAEAALAGTPEGQPKDERLQLMLGRAEIRAGAKDKGDATLTALIKSTEAPGMMNDASYYLADAGLELKLAESVIRKALDELETESQTWTLDEYLATLRQKTKLIQAAWDSMGWVYFREGRMQEAQAYIEASWKGRQDEEVGKHMGELAEAHGDKNAALAAYQRAEELNVHINPMGVREHSGPEEKLLTDKMDRLRREGAKAATLESSSESRVFPQGAAKGLNGVGSYRILVRDDTVVLAKPDGGHPLAGGDARILGAKLKGLTPAGAKANLMYQAMLNCHQNLCEVILEP